MTADVGTTGPAAEPRWRLRSRVIVAVVFALGTVLLVSTVVGVFGDVYGAADQGDGPRLMCSADLVAIGRPAQLAFETPVLQTQYRRVSSVCASRFPTSRFVALQIAAAFGTGTFDLRWLAVVEILTLAGVAAMGALLLSARGWSGIAVVVVVVITAAAPAFARFFISPLEESSGLVGAVGLLLGAASLFSARDPRPRWERRAALALTWFGAAYGGFAKPPYVGIALVGVVVLATTKGASRWITRPRALAPYLPGLCLALILLACTGLYVTVSNHWARADRQTGVRTQDVNTHDFVFLGAVPELERAGVTLDAIGLSRDLQFAVGTPFYGHEHELLASDAWVAAIQQHDDATRRRVTIALLEHPSVVVSFVREAVFASREVDVADLPANAVGTVAHRTPLRQTLDLPVHVWVWLLSRWHGAVGLLAMLVALAMPVAGSLLARRRREPQGAGSDLVWLARISAVAALAALSTYVLAVFGGGYWDLAKHVLPPTYFATIALMLLPFALWAFVRELTRSRRGSVQNADGDRVSDASFRSEREHIDSAF